MDRLTRLLRFWFTFDAPVSRRAYLTHGAALMGAKYAVDAALIRVLAGGAVDSLGLPHDRSRLRTLQAGRGYGHAAAAPPPLREWSPYAGVLRPHLDGYFRARRGEFRLVRLPGNRTRLEGSTWYELRIAPEPYWGAFADVIVRRIHHRVLEHIATTTVSVR